MINLDLSGEDGITNKIEITPLGQTVCNHSPRFKEALLPVFCQNESFAFDHFAIDSDGDQLIYKLCSPLMRCSKPNNANCGFLIPSYPPPFPSVVFVYPYSYTTPLGPTAQFSINPLTGLMQGTPDVAGKFAAGICVEEYRNGQLLSRMLRDIQFYIVPCVPHLHAAIEEGQWAGDKKVIRLCEQPELLIHNISTDSNYIGAHTWQINQNTYTNKDLQVSLPKSGTYIGQLLLTGTDPVCKDSLSFIVHYTDSLAADFTYAYDTCVAGPVQFTHHAWSSG